MTPDSKGTSSVGSQTARRRIEAATLVTGNPNKVLEAERICGFSIQHAQIDLPEIQSALLAEVANEKAREAWRQIKSPVIVDETGLELASMNGFPGPLVKWMLDAIGPDGIARTVSALGDPRAAAVCMLAYYDGSAHCTGEGRTEGVLVRPPRGDNGFGWDPVFQAIGEIETYAQLAQGRKDEIGHRGRAWRALLSRMA